MKILKIIIATTMFATFLNVGLFGMMTMTGHHHEPGCPFMPGEHVICQMDVFDHIDAWQSMFTTTLPSLILLLSVAAIAFFVFKREWPPDIPILAVLLSERHHRTIPNLYQQLFSRGILNPKIP